MVFPQGRRKLGDEAYPLDTSQDAGRPRTQWEARFNIRLFHRHTLGQVPRLIHIFSTQDRNVIGQQLQRDRKENGRQ
jgi:hypothetical protein